MITNVVSNVLEVGDLNGDASVLSRDKGLERAEVTGVGVEFEGHFIGVRRMYGEGALQQSWSRFTSGGMNRVVGRALIEMQQQFL